MIKKINPIKRIILPNQNTKLNPGSLFPDLNVKRLKSKAIAPLLRKMILAELTDMYVRPTPANKTRPIRKAIAKNRDASRFSIIL
jgi:hypothetical protein